MGPLAFGQRFGEHPVQWNRRVMNCFLFFIPEIVAAFLVYGLSPRLRRSGTSLWDERRLGVTKPCLFQGSFPHCTTRAPTFGTWVHVSSCFVGGWHHPQSDARSKKRGNGIPGTSFSRRSFQGAGRWRMGQCASASSVGPEGAKQHAHV